MRNKGLSGAGGTGSYGIVPLERFRRRSNLGAMLYSAGGLLLIPPVHDAGSGGIEHICYDRFASKGQIACSALGTCM